MVFDYVVSRANKSMCNYFFQLLLFLKIPMYSELYLRYVFLKMYIMWFCISLTFTFSSFYLTCFLLLFYFLFSIHIWMSICTVIHTDPHIRIIIRSNYTNERIRCHALSFLCKFYKNESLWCCVRYYISYWTFRSYELRIRSPLWYSCWRIWICGSGFLNMIVCQIWLCVYLSR